MNFFQKLELNLRQTILGSKGHLPENSQLCRPQNLYFSKEIIPYFDEKRIEQKENCPVFHHVGIYAYSPETLLNYNLWKESNLEVLEGLEQLRFLENGHSIKCVLVDSKGRLFWELNNTEDVIRIEKAIKENQKKAKEK